MPDNQPNKNLNNQSDDTEIQRFNKSKRPVGNEKSPYIFATTIDNENKKIVEI